MFDSGEQVTDPGGGDGTVTTSGLVVTPGKINRYTGEIFYVENRTAVERADGQIEDIKLIIEI